MKSFNSKISNSVLFVAIALSFFSFQAAANPEKAGSNQLNSHDDGASDGPGGYSVRRLTLASDSVSAAPADSGFDWGGDCDAGSGEFSQLIAYRQVETIGVVPDNKRNISVQLESSSDIDIRLIDVARPAPSSSVGPTGSSTGPPKSVPSFRTPIFATVATTASAANLGMNGFPSKANPVYSDSMPSPTRPATRT